MLLINNIRLYLQDDILHAPNVVELLNSRRALKDYKLNVWGKKKKKTKKKLVKTVMKGVIS